VPVVPAAEEDENEGDFHDTTSEDDNAAGFQDVAMEEKRLLAATKNATQMKAI